MYVWFVVLLALGSLTAGYFFYIGQQLGRMSINTVGEWWWRRGIIDRAERRYAEPCEPSFEIELEPTNAAGLHGSHRDVVEPVE